MTCIVGLVSKGKVYIGADSLGSDGFTQQIRKEPKVFKNGDFLIGCTSSFRMIDLLKWKFNPPTVKDDNLHKFMVTDFVDAVRTLFVDNGYNITSDDWRSGCFFDEYYDNHGVFIMKHFAEQFSDQHALEHQELFGETLRYVIEEFEL